jgi:hypothetical protein
MLSKLTIYKISRYGINDKFHPQKRVEGHVERNRIATDNFSFLKKNKKMGVILCIVSSLLKYGDAKPIEFNSGIPNMVYNVSGHRLLYLFIFTLSLGIQY